MKQWLRALEVLAWFAFFAFAALVLALRYWVLPDIERYRGDIVAAISRAVGLQVKVGAIEAGWQGMRPQISLSDVRIYDAQGREALVLPEVDNVLSWRSLLHWDLRLHSLVVEAPRLGVRRDAAGVLYVAGIKLSGEGDGRFSDWALGQEEIVIRNAEIEWRDEKRGAPPLALSGLELRLRNSGHEHSFGLTARPPPELGSTVELRARLVGESVMQPAAWNGRLYAELGYTDLAAWRAWIDYPLDVRHGIGALRLWASLAGGKVSQASADVALAEVVAQLGEGLAPLELASLSGRLQGRVRPGGFELAGRSLALVPALGEAVPATDFQLAWRSGGGALSAKLLELGTLPQLAASFPMPERLRSLLDEAAPRGRVEDASFEWQGELPEPERYALRGRFSGLALRAVQGAPGFEGLSGSIDATQARGRLVLQSKHAQLDLPRVLPEPRVALDTLSGQLDWERHGSALAVRLVSLAFANADLAGSSSGSYSRAGENSGRVDLSGQLTRADGTQLARYLPHASLMGEATRQWLLGAILAGRASDVRLRLRGNLRDFPFRDPASGQFQVTAQVDEGVLEYARGWPRIENIRAELLFERDRMEIVGRSGSILGARLANVRVSIPQMVRGGTRLAVAGEADGPSGEFLKFVSASPLRAKTGALTETLSATGRARLRLRLELPLADLDASKVAGEVEFAGNLALHPELPRLERAAGRLTFTEAGFALHDVRARALGGPVAIRGGTRPGGEVEVVARGEATLEAARALFDHPWSRYLSGTSAAYVATFGVRDGQAQVAIESPLRGIAIALPPPFAKSAAEALALRVELSPSKSGVRERISVSLGTLAAAAISRRKEGDTMEVRRASLWLSPVAGEAIRLPERPGTLLYGSLPALDADAWLQLLEKEDPSEIGAIALDLKIGVLDAYGKRLHDLALRAGGEPKGWSAYVSAAELSGDVTYRSENGGLLVARLDHFTIPEDVPGARAAEAGASARPSRQPTDVPAVDAVIERFSYRGRDLGRVEVAAQHDAQAWRFDKLKVSSPEATLNARGTWKSGLPSRTALDFDFEAADGGSFLGRMGHPGLVKGAKTSVKGSLAWQGSPLGVDYASLSGDVELHAQDGQFLEVEPGLGKLVSLMSLQALPRRITLDFRDVFSKGFQFERISAAAHLDHGVMALKQFKMSGSAAEVEMSGEADLARETQDLKVRVIPSIGSSASTAVAIVNPLAGVAAAIAQRVLKDPLGQIFAYDYAVTGSWSDPKVAKLYTGVPPQLPAQ